MTTKSIFFSVIDKTCHVWEDAVESYMPTEVGDTAGAGNDELAIGSTGGGMRV